MTTEVEAYRAEADRLRKMAERAHTPIGRAALLEMAEQYEALVVQIHAIDERFGIGEGD